jgi:small subunit ribosomal protein S6
LRESTRAPRKYELMTILHPEVEEESLPGELDRILGYITAIGGELIDSLRESPWGRRRLAYPIRSGGKDVRDGYYTVWHFTAAPNQLLDLERELKLNTQLIRYIIVSWEPKPIDPKEVEAAEIAAEEAAAAAYAAAQAAEAAAESEADSEAAEAYAAAQAAAQAAESAAASDAAAAVATETESPMGLVAQVADAEALTAEAEAVEATGVELAIEAVAAVEAREELEEDAAAAVAKAEAEAAAEDADVPANAIRGTESGECPDDFPVKGNASSKLYHTPGSPSYNRTIPEFCFASVEAAEAAGFGPTKYEAAHEDDASE